MKIPKNMGTLDRSIRALVGLALIMVGVWTGMWWMYIIAVILLVTSTFAFCPLYKPFGIKSITCKEDGKEN